MNLCADIGNSRIKIGLFEGRTLIKRLIWVQWSINELVELARQFKIKKIIFSSVSTPGEEILPELESICPVKELNSLTKLPFENTYTTPETLGKDRLAAVAGAHALFPEKNCLVIDCGTCIKYDLINAQSRYLGGNIAPGANMRIEAMHHFTARLPLVEMEMPANPCGNSTQTALQNGALKGASLEMNGFIQLFSSEYSPLQIILTGGDATFFEPHLSSPNVQLVPDLVLYGLNHILIYSE
jgi:type III pantothenate kinase